MIGSIRQDRPVTIVAAMHDLSLAGQFTDRLVMLAEGRIVATGTAQEVLTPELIRKHYNTEVAIVDVPGDGIAVVPKRKT